MANQTTAKGQLSWLNRINLAYGAFGLLVIGQVGLSGDWKSFLAGWVVAMVNLELIKRITVIMVSVFKGEKLNPIFYGFLFGKFAFWGLVFAMFSFATWIQAIPFVL